MNNLDQDSSCLTAGQLAAIIAATCLLLGNICYAQPILYEIAASLQIDVNDSGLIVAFGQAGYITWLLVIAPLGNTLDNRKLCAFMTL